jgi:hypothetical protein
MRFPRDLDKFAQRAKIFKKHKQPVGLMASLKESVDAPRKPRRTSKT